MEEQLRSQLKSVTEDLLVRLHATGTVVVHEEEGGLIATIDSAESAILIGWRGSTLAALEYLVRALVFRSLEDRLERLPEIHLDIGGYRQRQIDEIRELTTKIATQVQESGEAEVLRPMNPFERRIVHVVIKEHAAVIAESIGADPNRRVVIKPKPIP